MELVKSSIQSLKNVPDSEVLVVHEKILTTLQLYGPMPVQELVEKNPQFRWVEVLRAVSRLWGEGKLEVEHYKGQLKIWSTGEYDHVEFPGYRLGKRKKSSWS